MKDRRERYSIVHPSDSIKRCPHCGSDKKLVRIIDHNRIACRNCLQWAEYHSCRIPKCVFCENMAATPNGIDWDDKGNTLSVAPEKREPDKKRVR